MYKLLKEKGNNASVSVLNTDTGASLIVGRMSVPLLSILEDMEKLKFGDGADALNYKDAWEVVIKDETKEALARLTLRMSKPVRDQSVKAKTEQPEVKQNKQIDAMDVLLGLASYN